MKINLKNRIVSSGIIIFVVFIVSIIILYITKPKYITEISDEGKTKINGYLLISISLLFGIVAGITRMLLIVDVKIAKKEHTHHQVKMNFNPAAYRP